MALPVINRDGNDEIDSVVKFFYSWLLKQISRKRIEVSVSEVARILHNLL